VAAKLALSRPLEATMDRCAPASLSTASGEAVLDIALDEARRAWGERLVAAYALGSLAHGGFSPHVSDVDFGVVVADPVEPGDEERAASLSARVRASAMPLADRFSLFWGSRGTLSGRVEGGRFPPVDRADLREHGRLLAGTDVRSAVAIPSAAEMVLAAARLALTRFSTDEAIGECRDPSPLIEAGPRALTKRILFPVRFLYTARTGRIGLNDQAVAHFVKIESGPGARLAQRALEWRHEPFGPGDASVLPLAAAGLLPLYRLFVAEYLARLRTLHEADLAAAYRVWYVRLAPA
jgi:predicted nucleotidyltransferase